MTSPAALLLDGNSLTLEDMESVARGQREVGVAPGARAGVVRARKVVDDAVAQQAVVYGVNTGFGNFADVVIPAGRLRELQLNLVRSHAAGVGDPLTREQTRALMLLRANDARAGGGRETDLTPAPRDRFHVLQREAVAVEEEGRRGGHEPRLYSAYNHRSSHAKHRRDRRPVGRRR